MNKVYDYLEYSFSAQAVVDLPKLISLYDKMVPVLKSLRHYTAAAEVLDVVLDNQFLLEVQLSHYQNVFNSKGQIKEKENNVKK